MLQVMLEVAATIEVPDEDIATRRAVPGVAALPEGDAGTVPLHIRTSANHPDESFVAVQYRNLWFYIADDDLPSKAVFTFLMLLFSLADTTERQALPLITIPAG